MKTGIRCRALQIGRGRDVDDQQAMEGQALGRVDAERDHSRGRDRSTSTLASASPAILCGKEGRTLISNILILKCL